MRLSIFLVERNRLQGCCSRCRVSLERLYINVRQKKPNFCDPSPGTPKSRIFLESAIKETERPPQIFLAAFVREIEALKIKIVRIRVLLLMGGKRNGQLDL